MGKTRHNRRRNKGAEPTGLPSVKDIVKETENEGDPSNSESPSDAAIQSIVDQLQGTVEDKVFALHSLASIFNTASCVQEAVRQKVARIAGPLLLDPSSAVRNAAAGALRNLTSSGNHEICDLLVEQDIMTPVSAFFHKYTTGEWQLPGNASSEDADTFAQAVHLLWNLCEGNGMAVQNFNDRNLLSVLIKHISGAPDHLPVTLAIMQCLITVVEDNSSACNMLQKSEASLSVLLSLQPDSSEALLLRVLTAGVMLKVRSDKSEILSPALLNAIICPLLQNQRHQLNELSNLIPDEDNEGKPALKDVSRLLEAQQVSLELITNLCSDRDEEMDLDSNSTYSDDGMCDMAVCEAESNLEDLNAAYLTMSPEVHEMIISQQLVQKIWEKTRPPAENVRGLLHEHSGGEHILKRVDVLRSRAFLCLNNIIPTLDIQDFGGPQCLFQMCSEIATLVFKNTEEDHEVLEAASSAMRAALQKLALKPHKQYVEIQFPQIEFIFSAAPNSNPSVRANVVKTVSMLGMMSLSQPSEQNFQILKCAGKFLLDACAHESELWVLAEALDSIVDLFGEDETDQAAAELGLPDHLQGVLPAFKRKAHMNRKKLGDHQALISTVNANLPRFIRYKAKRISVLQTTLK